MRSETLRPFQPDAEHHKQDATDNIERLGEMHNELFDGPHTIGSHHGEHRVGGHSPQARQHRNGEVAANSGANDDNVDGPQRRRHRQADEDAGNEKKKVHSLPDVDDDAAAHLAGDNIGSNLRHLLQLHVGGQVVELREIEIPYQPIPDLQAAWHGC